MLTHLTPEALADTVGIFGFALAGIMAAAGRRVDPVGVFVLAFTTAFGGGLIRDIIIDRRPFYWVEHDYFVWGILVLTIFASARRPPTASTSGRTRSGSASSARRARGRRTSARASPRSPRCCSGSARGFSVGFCAMCF